jgi:hypothetical protein
MLRSAAHHVSCGRWQWMRPESACGSLESTSLRVTGEQFWMITSLDQKRRARRSGGETPAVVTATAEALDGRAQHGHSVALLPRQVHPFKPCYSPS